MKKLPRILALTIIAGGFVAANASSCAAPFDPQSLVNGVRVVSVDVDPPYAKAGDEVTFKINYFDGRDTGGEFTPIQITWLAGCYNPEGNQYYGCYEPLGELFEQVASGEVPPDGLVAQGPGLDTFAITLPEDIVSSVAEPSLGPRVGIGFVFFTVCAGTVRPVIQEGSTDAGFFPLGCFDEEGRELGPDAFVPGYTQVYAFEDERVNQNPAGKLLFGGKVRENDEILSAETCSITLEDRRKTGCAAPDELTECETIELDVSVDEDVGELDPDGFDAEGNQLHEVVWVSYFATDGSFDGDIKLIYDAKEGLVDDRATEWVPPEEPGLYTLWAVLRDNRGGSTTIRHLVEVE